MASLHSEMQAVRDELPLCQGDQYALQDTPSGALHGRFAKALEVMPWHRLRDRDFLGSEVTSCFAQQLPRPRMHCHL